MGAVFREDDTTFGAHTIDDTISERENAVDPPSTRLETNIAMMVCSIIVCQFWVLRCEILD
jgi:hypothetical protein